MGSKRDGVDTIQPDVNGDIAIIGMACIFPGAPDVRTYWQNIVDRVDAITDPPPEAWDADVFYDPSSTSNDRVYCKRGGYLGPLAEFRPTDYGIMPLGLDGGEPDQWLALKVAYDALGDAGYLERLEHNDKERHMTAVILGKGTYLNHGNLNMVQHSLVVEQTLQVLRALHPEYTASELELLRKELKRGLPPFDAESAPGLVPNISASRVANRLDLMGPTYTVDAACASSLIAVEIATNELIGGRCDLALVGGVQVTTPIPILSLFCQLKALSRQERIRPFDRAADGTILGEGLGMVVLKRRLDAERDGDRIYAVIKGVGVASDGRAVGVLAPRVEGAELSLRRAYERSGISPTTVELIEAHGTGTIAGDRMEIQALQRVFGNRTGLLPRCALGTIKSMIGHTMPAAGIAGLIKAALAVYHKVLPPTLNFDEPNPAFDLEQTAFYVNTETRPWIHGSDANHPPRRAGVDAFGFGGINAHAIVEEHPAPVEAPGHSSLRHWDSELVILEAASRDALVARVLQLRSGLESCPDLDLVDLAFTLNGELSNRPCRLALVVDSLPDLQSKLARAAQRLSDPRCKQIKDRGGIYFFETPLYRPGTLAFMFPGEGSQYVHMLADLCIHFPEIRGCFDRMDGIFLDHPRGYLPSDLIFPRPALGAESDTKPHLWQIDAAVEAVLTANEAMFLLLTKLGIQPDAVVGHSTGEYSAMRTTGVIPLSDTAFVEDHLLELNRIYSEQIAQNADVPRAVLVAVGEGLDRLAPLIAQAQGEVYVGMDNCPHQTVLVGAAAAMDPLVERMRGQGMIYEILPFDRAYHTPLFAAYNRTLSSFFEHLPLSTPETRLYSCTTASPFPSDVAQIRALAIAHWNKPVRFRETIQAMYADGVRIFVEVGARGNLVGFVGDILRQEPHLAFASNVPSRSGILQLHHLLGLLRAQNVPMDLRYLYQRRNCRSISLEDLASTQGTAGPAESRPDGTVKLKTGWVGIEVSPQVAAEFGHRNAPRGVPTLGTPTEDGTVRPLSAPIAAPVIDCSTDLLPAASPAPAPGQGRDAVMQSHLQIMDQFLEVQEAIMRQYLTNGRSGAPLAAVHHPVAETPAASATPAVDQLAAAADAAPPVPPADQPPVEEPVAASESIPQALLRVISERTGYPVDMLKPSANLEADLGIDSIKRTEILGAFIRETGLMDLVNMEQVSALKTVQEIVDLLSRQQAGESVHAGAPEQAVSPEPQKQRAWPFVREIISSTPGQALEVLCELSLSEDLYLRDHILGGAVSPTDPELLALPIVPLTISIEILAEAAAYLLPGQTLIGIKDVRAYRWILLEEESVALRIVAERRAAPDDRQVTVYLTEADSESGTGSQSPIIEGTMVFADAYPAPPPTDRTFPRTQQVSRWTADQLYTEGMFHGPAFRAVSTIDRSGEDGLVATMQALPTDQLLRSHPNPAFVAEPIILDAAGQLVGFWTMEHLESGFVVFPFRLQTLNLYGPPLEAPQQVACRARIELVSNDRTLSDIYIDGPDGQLRLELLGWEDMRFDIPHSFYQFLLSPGTEMFSERWNAPLDALPDADQLRCCRVSGLDGTFLAAHGRFWEKVLMRLILSRAERAYWSEMRGTPKRRADWLLGRVAAKDAVRLFVRDRYGLALSPADVEIVADKTGRPTVQGPWLEQVGQPIAVSLAHADGIAVAVVGPDSPGSAGSVGIDVERVKETGPEIRGVAFTPAEQEMLAQIEGSMAGAAALHLWCAKEAVGKALGEGLAGGPLSIVADGFSQTGVIQLRLHGEMARMFPKLDGRAIVVYTIREDDLVVALCVLDER